uniref:Uncharacterized protein n=1 Tax=Arion vulgaris TaxID=1028688 RepID=A0A0B6ZVM4_9EUPU
MRACTEPVREFIRVKEKEHTESIRERVQSQQERHRHICMYTPYNMCNKNT